MARRLPHTTVSAAVLREDYTLLREHAAAAGLSINELVRQCLEPMLVTLRGKRAIADGAVPTRPKPARDFAWDR